MKYIQLTRGKVSVVDDADFELLLDYKWYANSSKNGYYAATTINRKIVYMHRFLLNPSHRQEIDHRDGDGLNNQRSNLRLVTHAQNCANRIIQSNNKSGYKGVYWRKDTEKWTVQIKVESKRINLGAFTDVVKAAKAYEEASLKYQGEFSYFSRKEE